MFLSFSAIAQQHLQVIDSETDFPIAGVFIELLDINQKKVNSGITNADGNIRFEISGAYSFIAHHMGYKTFYGTLTSEYQVIKLSPGIVILNDVVVTGQYHPQSANNSVYSIRTIDKETIANQGSVQLSDVLSKELNMRLNQDLATGETGITMQGMSGSNIKILIDGVPLVGRNGNGNNADMSQINLNTVERIEIVEGPMAVNFGANALGGVINLITKSTTTEKFTLGASIQGESIDVKTGVGVGKYAANLYTAYRIIPRLGISTNIGMTRFNGYQGDESGREFLWNPKNQFFGDLKINFTKEKTNIYYKLDYLYEDIYDAGGLAPGQTVAFDEKFITNRFIHQIQASGSLYNGNRYAIVFSYSDNNRIKNRFVKDLVSGEKTNVVSPGAQDTTSYHVFSTRGSYSVVNLSPWLDFELGYDINLEQTTGGRLVDGSQAIQDYAIYSSAELSFIHNLKIRPGLRWSYNSKFNSPLIPSINLKFSPSRKVDIRAAYGRGYRAPGLRELYLEFIDATHRVFGNDQLKPETSHHFDAGFVFKSRPSSLAVNSEFTVFYNNITNLIDFAYSETDAGYAKYTNIGAFKSLGFNLKERLIWKNLETGIGFSYIGRYDNPGAEDIPVNYLFSPQVAIDVTYKEPKTQISLSSYYKFNGPLGRYTFSTDANGNSIYNVGSVDGYHLLDITASRMLGKMLRLTIGGKNLFNITNVNNSNQSAGGVHSGGGTTAIGYGRSFFTKINFNLINNKN